MGTKRRRHRHDGAVAEQVQGHLLKRAGEGVRDRRLAARLGVADGQAGQKKVKAAHRGDGSQKCGTYALRPECQAGKQRREPPVRAVLLERRRGGSVEAVVQATKFQT